ncbi:MAG TPA: hypothetical protein VF432_08365 [Thermoanaerobaculia bacterium]
MRTDPLHAAGWCVVVMAALVFVTEVRRIAEGPPVPPGTATVATATVRSVTVEASKPSTPRPAYVGNTNKHKFHKTSCRYATCPNCTVRFATREEAIEAGFRPGGCCNP